MFRCIDVAHLSHYSKQSSFLDLLFKYQCIRTQKKQKVFYWYVLGFDPGPLLELTDS